MATHPSTLVRKIPWMEEPGRLQFMGSLRVGHDFTSGEGNGNPLQCSCLENPRDRGAWWASIYGVAQSRTRLKRLSSSSSSRRCLLCCTFYSSLLCFLSPHHSEEALSSITSYPDPDLLVIRGWAEVQYMLPHNMAP